MTTTPWIKATASSGGQQCVEMRRHDDHVEVRDTKDRGRGPVLRVAPGAFAGMLDRARQGWPGGLG